MKHIIILLTIVLASLNNLVMANTEIKTDSKPKVLIAYFSATGNTKQVAETIANISGGKLYEIVPFPRYTESDLDWHDKHSRSSIEMNDTECRPVLGGDTITTSDYDIIFIGYPIWWDLAPRQVNTFIESHDFTGKVLIPFATSGSSSIDGSQNDLKKLYPDYQWIEGKLLNDPNLITPWIESIIQTKQQK